jgi:CBS domain-containing protein
MMRSENKEDAVRVSEIMHTPAVTCRPSTSLREVAQLMERRNVGSVVVVDDIGYLSGIVTDRDLALRGMGGSHTTDTPVTAVATRDVATVSPMSDAGEAAAIMQKRAVRRVPVVDDLGRVHGMVTFDDLFRNLNHEADTLTDALLGQVSQTHTI